MKRRRSLHSGSVGLRPAFTQFIFLARFTLFITFLFFPDNFEVIKSVYLLFYKMLKKQELLRKTNDNFIKIDLNFSATLASPSFKLATLGIESKTLNPTATEAYTIK
jgi:hypothetical protein